MKFLLKQIEKGFEKPLKSFVQCKKKVWEDMDLWTYAFYSEGHVPGDGALCREVRNHRGRRSGGAGLRESVVVLGSKQWSSPCWKPQDFRKLSSGLIEYLGGGRKVYISNSNLRVNTCVKIGNSKKGRDGKTRNKFCLLMQDVSCIKPAIIMSWVLLADHEDSWMIGLIANAARSTGRKNGISSHSLVLQGEDGSHSLDFLLRGEESQTSLRLTPETVLRTLEQPLANNYGSTLKRLAREKSSLALK